MRRAVVGELIKLIFKCKRVNEQGAEQLLIDSHVLKSSMLKLPQSGENAEKGISSSYMRKGHTG